MTRSLLPGLLICCALASVAPVPAAAELPWYEHYAAAEKALVEERWTDAVAALTKALELRGDSAARARTYGMRFTAYFPYLGLGIAYYHLDQVETALQAFDTEERLGAIRESPSELAQLERYRELARTALDEETERQRRHAQEVLDGSLAAADRLEQEGRLEAAIEALGDGLLVAPDDPRAVGRLERLAAALTARDERQRALERRRDLVRRGRELLAAGSFAEAASVLQQALAVDADETVSGLLARAQEGLRAALATAPANARGPQPGDALARARELRADGRTDAALEALQVLLAAQPGNDAALALQRELIEARAEAARTTQRQAAASDLLATIDEDLAGGRLGRVVAGANRLLALEPGNPAALERLAGAYREINRNLLDGNGGPSFPPAIHFVDLRRELADGSRVELTDRAELRLDGVVVDDAPVEISLTGGVEAPDGGGSVKHQRLGGLFIHEFHFVRRLAAGTTTFRLTATDPEGLSSSGEYAVVYAPPWHRRPLTWGLAAALLGGIAALAWGLRRRRHRRLTRRRFNPYTAGTPVPADGLFVGRERLVERILQTVHNNSLLLYGERRIGKTSLQHHLKRRLESLDDPDYAFYPVFIDLQGTREERFFATLAEEIFDELGPRLGDLQPRSSAVDDYTYHDFVHDLRAILKRLGELDARQARLVLLIDEVDELNAYDPRVNQKLRSLFMKTFAENLVAVVSGVSIQRDWEREGSPWYNFFEEMEVEPLRPEEARTLVERPVGGLVRFDAEAVERILALADGRPYRIQKVCMELLQDMYEAGRTRIAVADVEARAERERTAPP